MELTDPVDKIMTLDFVSLSKETDLQIVITKMAEMNISSAVLVDDGKISGILTERDLVQRVLGKGLDISKLKAKDVMTPAPLKSIPPGAKLYMVIKLMKENRIKSVPIIDHDECKGVITQTDIVRALVD